MIGARLAPPRPARAAAATQPPPRQPTDAHSATAQPPHSSPAPVPPGRNKSNEGKLATLTAINSALQSENEGLRQRLAQAAAPTTATGAHQCSLGGSEHTTAGVWCTLSCASSVIQALWVRHGTADVLPS